MENINIDNLVTLEKLKQIQRQDYLRVCSFYINKFILYIYVYMYVNIILVLNRVILANITFL